ncbi:MAG: hypothetical protein QXM22_05400 [Candidatus Bathyarchaeia archaeon]
MVEVRIRKVILLILGFVMIAAFQVGPVFADVPNVLSIVPWTSGTDTILNITVRHASPTSVHFVNRVEVEVNGTVQTINLSWPPVQTNPFIVQHNLGQIVGIVNVRARPNCNVHGNGGDTNWFGPVEVPEFLAVQLLAVLAVISALLLFLRPKMRGVQNSFKT